MTSRWALVSWSTSSASEGISCVCENVSYNAMSEGSRAGLLAVISTTVTRSAKGSNIRARPFTTIS